MDGDNAADQGIHLSQNHTQNAEEALYTPEAIIHLRKNTIEGNALVQLNGVWHLSRSVRLKQFNILCFLGRQRFRRKSHNRQYDKFPKVKGKSSEFAVRGQSMRKRTFVEGADLPGFLAYTRSQ
jgi:hypothetical protein